MTEHVAITSFALVAALTLSTSCASPGSQIPHGQNSAAPSPSLPPLEICVPASDMAREVGFRSTKGEQVVGAVLGDGDVGVILAHMVDSDLCEWLPYAERLRALGRRVLIFDFGLDLVGDVAGAADELRLEGATKIVLVGGSMGGTASLVAASLITPAVDGVASLSGPAAFKGMDAAAASKQLTVPVLYMAAESDQSRPFDFPRDARAMFAACPSRHKQLLIVQGTDHGSDLLSGPAAAQARAVLESFIADVTT